jgi:hypothetical protein
VESTRRAKTSFCSRLARSIQACNGARDRREASAGAEKNGNRLGKKSPIEAARQIGAGTAEQPYFAGSSSSENGLMRRTLATMALFDA